eukprot:1156458-Pelagomonas_calceolata.AAC.10
MQRSRTSQGLIGKCCVRAEQTQAGCIRAVCPAARSAPSNEASSSKRHPATKHRGAKHPAKVLEGGLTSTYVYDGGCFGGVDA